MIHPSQYSVSAVEIFGLLEKWSDEISKLNCNGEIEASDALTDAWADLNSIRIAARREAARALGEVC